MICAGCFGIGRRAGHPVVVRHAAWPTVRLRLQPSDAADGGRPQFPLLDEELHLGTAMGAVLIVMGLYAVLWVKGHEAVPKGPKVGGSEHPTTTSSGDDSV